jgi:hypothetical protein
VSCSRALDDVLQHVDTQTFPMQNVSAHPKHVQHIMQCGGFSTNACTPMPTNRASHSSIVSDENVAEHHQPTMSFVRLPLALLRPAAGRICFWYIRRAQRIALREGKATSQGKTPSRTGAHTSSRLLAFSAHQESSMTDDNGPLRLFSSISSFAFFG